MQLDNIDKNTMFIGNSLSTVQASIVQEKKTTVIVSGILDKTYWRDMWYARELLFFLVWRDLLVRYKQTVLGVSWVLIRPLLTLVIFSFVFGRLAGMSSNGLPYPLMVFSGILPWFLFSTTVSDCMLCLVANGGLIGKIYFPRMTIPLNALIVNLVDYLVSCLLIVVVMVWCQVMPSIKLLLLPVLTLWVAALAFGLGVWLAALTIRYRDLRHLIPFVLQLGIYVSPIGYTATVIPQRWQMIYSLNPLVGIVGGYRWALMGDEFMANMPSVYLSIGLTVLILVSGIRYFRRRERSFVDYL